MIQRLEELAINAWPATQTMLYDGWVLRLAGGYTRRANSVNPLYPSTLDVQQKLDSCRSFYHARGLPLIFKMTPAVYPENLDELLAGRGFQLEALTSMQTLDLTALKPADAASGQVELYQGFSEEWLADFYRISESPAANRAAHRDILKNLAHPTAFCTLRVDGRAAACGLAVLEDGYLGIYDVATHPAFRRRGRGLRLMEELLGWGRQNGAQTAYLQVMKNNPPALNLYARLGFEEKYVYWYRVQPTLTGINCLPGRVGCPAGRLMKFKKIIPLPASRAGLFRQAPAARKRPIWPTPLPAQTQTRPYSYGNYFLKSINRGEDYKVHLRGLGTEMHCSFPSPRRWTL